MIKRILSVYFILMFFVIQTNAQEIRDLIDPVKIFTNKTDTVLISDIFYTSDYSTFEIAANKNIDAKYDKSTNKLVLKSKGKFEGFTSIPFKLNGKEYQIPVQIINPEKNKVTVNHKFSYKPDGKVSKVSVFGNFNGWNRDSHLMKDSNNEGVYEIEIPLEPGDYQYKIRVDNEEIPDPENPERVPTGFDNFNSVLSIARPNVEKVFLHTLAKENSGDKVILHFVYEIENSKSKIKKENVFALINNEKISDKNIKLEGNKIQVSLDKKSLTKDKILRVAVSENGKVSNLVTSFLNEKLNENFTWYDGVIYSIMIDRFADGDKNLNVPIVHDSIFYQANYQGGDLKGIIDKLNEGYFDSLGINILWISPVYDNPNVAFREYPEPNRWYSGYHGYWPISSTEVDDHFGTMETLKELIKNAQSRNIKVLLDFVANHTHADHPLYKEHPDWFGTLDLPDGRKNLRLWDEYRLTTWFEPYMPSFDYSNEDAIKFMTDNAVWWLETTGADGFRHDAVKHVPNEFWRELTRKIKEKVEVPQNKKVYQIGETFGDYDLVASYVNNGQLSSQFNFNLSYFSVPIFTDADKSFQTLDYQMEKTFSAFGYLNLMGNIMDSHDKTRFMAYADGDIQKQGVDSRVLAWNDPPTVDDPKSYNKGELYYAFMMTIPGLPVVYYGSEFGMTGADDPDNRRFMRFGNALVEDEKEMLKSVSKLIKIRNEHPVLRYGDFQTLIAENTTYSYLRSDLNEKILVVLNKEDKEKNVKIELPEVYNFTNAVDLISGEKVNLQNNSVNLSVENIGYRILKLN